MLYVVYIAEEGFCQPFYELLCALSIEACMSKIKQRLACKVTHILKFLRKILQQPLVPPSTKEKSIGKKLLLSPYAMTMSKVPLF